MARGLGARERESDKQPLAPQDLEAEETVLGAMMLSPSAVDAAREILVASDFYRVSNGRIFDAALAIRDADADARPDAILIAAELERRGQLEEIGGRKRIHELAALVPAAGNVKHYAELVLAKSRQRRILSTIEPLRVACLNGGADPNETQAIIRQLSELADRAPSSVALVPLDLGALLSGPMVGIAWLWEGWLARGDLALIVGDPGVGKSMLGLGLAAATRQGSEFLGAQSGPGRVGVFDFENPLDEAQKRLRALGLTADDHEGLVYFHAPALDLQTSAGHALLVDALERHSLDLAIVDSLRRSAPGLDENDSGAVSAVLSPLRSLTATTGRTIAVVHHARKRIGDNPTEAGQMVRGSGDLVASVDSLLYLRAKESGSFTLEHAKARRGVPHEPILVRIEGDDGSIGLVSEGAVAYAEDKVEAMLARVRQVLAEDGGALGRQVIALKVGVAANSGTFSRALKLGYDRGILAKRDGERPTDPTLYALAEGVIG